MICYERYNNQYAPRRSGSLRNYLSKLDIETVVLVEVLSAATLKWLVARDKSDPSESQPPMLDNEIHQALREHIPYSNGSWRADELANIFPHEPFEFAEYLNAAAQWPGPNLDGSSVFGMQDMFDASHINLG